MQGLARYNMPCASYSFGCPLVMLRCVPHVCPSARRTSYVVHDLPGVALQKTCRIYSAAISLQSPLVITVLVIRVLTLLRSLFNEVKCS
jgi:hypothetical protein